MRLIVLAALVAALPGAASADGAKLPRYDVEAYCSKVAASVGGSATVENSCIEREQAAYNAFKQRLPELPAKAVKYCDGVASSIGGSYNILSTCVEREVGAQKSKPKFEY